MKNWIKKVRKAVKCRKPSLPQPPASLPPGYKYGWFSEQSADEQGYIEYTGRRNRVVDVTLVSDKMLKPGHWPDLRYVGPVRDYIRTVNCGQLRSVTRYNPRPARDGFGVQYDAEKETKFINGSGYRVHKEADRLFSKKLDRILNDPAVRERLKLNGIPPIIERKSNGL
jgi:hypothetical protein